MDAKLLAKFADEPEALTTAEIDQLAEACGEPVRSVAVNRRAKAIKAIAGARPPAPFRLEQLAEPLAVILKRMIAPRDARLATLERESADLKARVLELEAAAAAREPEPDPV